MKNSSEKPTEVTAEVTPVTSFPLKFPSTSEKGWKEEWDKVARRIILEQIPNLEQARDILVFFPSYNKVDNGTKINFWVSLLKAMAKLESGFNPHTIYKEPPPLNVDSVGLYQLSYEDNQYAHFGKLSRATKSLEDPINNLTIAIKILGYWINKDKVISDEKNHGGARYWSVLRPKRKLPEILKLIKEEIK